MNLFYKITNVMNPPAMKLLLRLYWIKRKEWEREKRKKKDRRVDKGKS